MKKYNYTTVAERDDIMAHAFNNGYTLIEMAEHLHENYLLYDTNVALKISLSAVETLELIVMLNEIQKFEQAQASTELIELMMMLGGM